MYRRALRKLSYLVTAKWYCSAATASNTNSSVSFKYPYWRQSITYRTEQFQIRSMFIYIQLFLQLSYICIQNKYLDNPMSPS